jgi:tetratricopeptide (TPR) repeat protein
MQRYGLQILLAISVWGAVLVLLLAFPEYSDTLRRLSWFGRGVTPGGAPTAPSSQDQWVRDLLMTAHNLVYYIWVVGAVAVGGASAVAFFIFQWWSQHSEILRTMSSWQDTVKAADTLISESAKELELDIIAIDFRDPKFRRDYRDQLARLRDKFSPEELDTRIANLAMLRPIPSTLYLRLGNYFRFRAAQASEPPTADGSEMVLEFWWSAIRRYNSALDVAKSEARRQRNYTEAYASHGVAVCLLQLDDPRRALAYAKRAVAAIERERADTNVASVMATYALALMSTGQLAEAVTAFEKALARARGPHAESSYNLACCLAKSGDQANVGLREELYRRALQHLEGLCDGVRSTELYVVEELATDGDFVGMRRHREFGPALARVTEALLEKLR